MQNLTDLGSLSIGGGDFLSLVEDVQWTSENEMDDITSPTRFNAAGQPVKRNAKMTVPKRSVKSGVYQVSHLDLSAATLAGLDVQPEATSLTLKVANQVNPAPSMGSYYRVYAVDPGGSIEADVAMEVADAGSVALQLAILSESDDPTDKAATLSFTLNGSAITVPGWLKGINHTAAGRQKVSVSFMGSDPGSGAYPTAPTGASTLLERALNAPKTPIAFTYTSHTVDGLVRSGYLLIQSIDITIEDGKIVRESYGFVVTGDWTTESNAEE